MITKKDDWNFIFDFDSPDYVEKFEKLIKLYLERDYADDTEFSKKRAIASFKELTKLSNWLYKIPIHEIDYIKHEEESTRYLVFFNYLDAIGLFNDYVHLYGDSDDALQKFNKAYIKLLRKHREGFEEEERLKKEEIKNFSVKSILSSVTGAISGKKFKSKVEPKERNVNIENNRGADYDER